MKALNCIHELKYKNKNNKQKWEHLHKSISEVILPLLRKLSCSLH